jgi:hypothetical protein
MIRAAIIASALFAAPAFAAPAFQAQPEAAPAAAKFVLRDTIWTCGDTGCAANASDSRAAVVCALLAKEVGALKTFSVRGEALAPDALAKCNARAKATASDEVRTAGRP